MVNTGCNLFTVTQNFAVIAIMEVEVNKLINKREIVVRRVQRILEIAQAAQNVTNKLVEFQVRFDSMNELVNAFDFVHLEVIALVDSTKLDEQYVDSRQF